MFRRRLLEVRPALVDPRVLRPEVLHGQPRLGSGIPAGSGRCQLVRDSPAGGYEHAGALAEDLVVGVVASRRERSFASRVKPGRGFVRKIRRKKVGVKSGASRR